MTPIVVDTTLRLPGHGLVRVQADCYRTDASSGVWLESAKVDGHVLSDAELGLYFPAGSVERAEIVRLAKAQPVPAANLLTAAEVDAMHAQSGRAGRLARPLPRRTSRRAA